MIKLDVINFIILIIAVVNTMYGLSIFGKNRTNRVNFSFFILTLAVSFWGLSMFAYRGFMDHDLVVFFSRILYVAASTIPLSFVFFVFELLYPSRFEGKNWKVLTWIEFIGVSLPFLVSCVFSMLPGFLINDVRFIPGQENFIVFNTDFHLYYAVYIICYFSWGYILLIKNFFAVDNASRNDVSRLQIFYITVGTMISTVIGVITNLLMPLLGNFSLNWAGQVGIVVMIVTISYSIVRLHLFNIRIVTTELFIFSLWIIMLGRVLTADTPQNKLIDVGVLTLAVGVGTLLIRSVLEEVRQREKIEALAHQLESVIHFLSHEVKGILGKNKTAFSMLLDKDFGDAPVEMQGVLSRSLKDTDDAVNMVLNILRSTDVGNGKMLLDLQPFDMETAVNYVVEALRHDAENRQLKLTYEVSSGYMSSTGETIMIIGDKENLTKHVFRNLIENAILYTPRGGEIRVGLKKERSKVIFSVKDNGIGITKDDMARLFTEGGRGKESIKTNVHSTGFGLFFAKGIVDAHNGRIWVESEGAGKGSTFYVELAAA